MNLANRQAARIKRKHALIETIQAGLAFGNELRLKLRLAISWHFDLHRAALALDGFGRRAIARVAGVMAGTIVFLVTQMIGHLALQSAFEQGFAELIEQPLPSGRPAPKKASGVRCPSSSWSRASGENTGASGFGFLLDELRGVEGIFCLLGQSV